MAKQVNYKKAAIWLRISWYLFFLAMFLVVCMFVEMIKGNYGGVAVLILSALGILIIAAIISGYYRIRYKIKKIPIEYIATQEELDEANEFKKKFKKKFLNK